MSTIELRDYQTKFLNDILTAWRQGAKRICGVMPTGAGKSITMAKLIKTLNDQGKTVYWLTHRRELIFQIADNFDNWDMPYSYIAAGKPFDASAKLFICSVQTLARKKFAELPQPDLIIADEAHLSAAQQFRKCVLGFDCRCAAITATPMRLDRKPLVDLYDTLILGPTIKELITSGHLAYPRIFVPSATAQLVREHQGEWKVTGGDYNKHALDKFFQDNTKVIHGDVLSHVKQYLYQKPTLVFCSSIRHVYDMVDFFNENSLTSAGIDGTLSDDKRREIIQQFKSGQIHYLMSNQLLIEGVDLVDVAGAVLLRPTKSLTVYLQSCGRALRVSDTKRECIILDHCNLTEKFGPVFIPRYFTLDGYGKRSKKDSVSGLDLSLCLKCGNYVKKRTMFCPICGNIFKHNLKQFKVLYEQLQCITIESAQKLIEDQCNKILTREKNRMTVRNKEYYLEKAVEWKIKGDHDEWADFKVRQDKENTRIYFEGSEAELLVMFAKRKNVKDPVAETKKALEARASRAENGSRQATVQIFESGTDEEILEYIKREKPDVTNPEAYLAGIKRKRVGAVLESGTPEQQAEALKLAGVTQVSTEGRLPPGYDASQVTIFKKQDRFDKMFEFAKTGKLTPRDESAPRVYTDEEANGFAAAVVRKDNKGKIDGGNKSDLLEVAAALHIPEERREKWADAVLATRK